MKAINLNNPNRQQGAVLVMALVMLTVLTLIGVSSMSSSTLELKVAGNTQQHDIAFQAAQSVIDITASEDPLNTNNYQVFKIDPNDPAFEQIINMPLCEIIATTSVTSHQQLTSRTQKIL